MTERDTPPQSASPEDERRQRANQEAARRPGVDAAHTLDERGHLTSTSEEGSSHQPLREGSQEQRDKDANSGYVLDQGAGAARDDSHGVSRRGAITQHGDTIRESQSAPGGGSVFQPLEADPSRVEDREALQRGNPPGQNHQGLNEGGPGEQIRERGERTSPKPATPYQDQRQP